MLLKAIILDLDNTIYPAPSISQSLFQPLFDLIETEAVHTRDMVEIKADLMRRPFQVVAKKYHFSQGLIESANNALSQLSYDGPIEPFPDYHFVRQLHFEKFLVTTGFQKLQQSKIDGLHLGKDFKEIHIVDTTRYTTSKKDVFSDIMQRHNFQPSEVIVVGDDLESEINAAIELGMVAILYDPDSNAAQVSQVKRITSMAELLGM